MLTYIATCLFGLEGLLGAEIDTLGYQRIQTMDGRITFAADAAAAAVCNIHLRFAERLYLQLGQFHAETFEELFQGIRSLPLEEWIGRNDAFPVRGHAIKSTLFSVPDCQKIIKKAAATRLGQIYGISQLPETGLKYQMEFFLFKNNASIMIDLSGTPLHKRGYRPQTVQAPLRETLAAAVAKLARPRENVLFCDPFCGSGTIAIEAAMMMWNIAPGLSRHFAAEDYPQFPKLLWVAAREAAKERARETKTDFAVRASDIDPSAIEIAAECAKRAGVSDKIQLICQDARTLESEGLRGTVATNPPYGERLMSPEEVGQLYRDIGQAWKKHLEKWQIYVLTSHEEFPKLYGRRADKIRKLYNGMIPCHLYQFFKNH